MVICKNCGAEVKAGNYCSNCGSRLNAGEEFIPAAMRGPEYGENWLVFRISRQSMNQMDCYSFEVRRMEEGGYFFSGFGHLEDGRYVSAEPSPLSDSAALELKALKIYNWELVKPVAPTPAGMDGMMAMGGMRDRTITSCGITFADGYSENKAPSEEQSYRIKQIMLAELKRIRI